MKTVKFKYRDKSKDIWCGDIVTECEFIGNLSDGRMLWRDLSNDCFRLVTVDKEGMNGWRCDSDLEKLL